MENAIKNNIAIMVDLMPTRDEIYTGICLNESNEVFIFICFNEETFEFDGIAIIRSREIESFRYWDEEELAEIKNNNYKDFINVIPIDKMNSFNECFEVLKSKKLIAVFTEDDDDSYYVGKIKSLSDDYVIIDLIDENAKWLEPQKILVKDITYIGFDSSYEKELMDKIE